MVQYLILSLVLGGMDSATWPPTSLEPSEPPASPWLRSSGWSRGVLNRWPSILSLSSTTQVILKSCSFLDIYKLFNRAASFKIVKIPEFQTACQPCEEEWPRSRVASEAIQGPTVPSRTSSNHRCARWGWCGPGRWRARNWARKVVCPLSVPAQIRFWAF